VPLTQAHPALAEKLRISTAGELINPFQIDNWWLVVRVERYTPALFDEAMERQMSEELFNKMVSEEAAARLRKIYQQSGAIARA